MRAGWVQVAQMAFSLLLGGAYQSALSRRSVEVHLTVLEMLPSPSALPWGRLVHRQKLSLLWAWLLDCWPPRGW